MAYTPVSSQSPNADGLNPTYTAIANGAGNGVTFANDGTQDAHVTNTTGGAVNLVLKANLSVAGVALPDKTIAIPANARRVFRWPVQGFSFDGAVRLEASATGLEVAIIK